MLYHFVFLFDEKSTYENSKDNKPQHKSQLLRNLGYHRSSRDFEHLASTNRSWVASCYDSKWYENTPGQRSKRAKKQPHYFKYHEVYPSCFRIID